MYVILFLTGLILSVICDKNKINTICDPAEEFKNYQLAFLLKKIDLIKITESDQIIGFCSTMECNSIFPKRINISMDELNDIKCVKLTIFNISRNAHSDGLWFSAFSTTKMTGNTHVCKPQIISKAKEIICNQSLLGDCLNVTCVAHMIYPLGKCMFHDSFIFKQPLREFGHISESNIVIQEKPTYYTTVCTLLIPRTNLIPEYFDVNVTVYPNVTDKDTDIQFGMSCIIYLRNDHVTPKISGTAWTLGTGKGSDFYTAMLSVVSGVVALAIVIVILGCFYKRKVFIWKPPQLEQKEATQRNTSSPLKSYFFVEPTEDDYYTEIDLVLQQPLVFTSGLKEGKCPYDTLDKSNRGGKRHLLGNNNYNKIDT